MIHQIRPVHKRKKEKRVGRGGKRGTYSGRGIKGQKARAGRKIKSEIKELILRFPKLRGLGFKKPPKEKPEIVNLKKIEEKFNEGEVVSPQTLFEKGIVEGEGKKPPKQVKILGEGNLTKKLIFKNCLFSESARQKIIEAGGKIE